LHLAAPRAPLLLHHGEEEGASGNADVGEPLVAAHQPEEDVGQGVLRLEKRVKGNDLWAEEAFFPSYICLDATQSIQQALSEAIAFAD